MQRDLRLRLTEGASNWRTARVKGRCVFVLHTLLLQKYPVGAGIIIVSKNRCPCLSSVYVIVRKTCSAILNKYK